MHSTRRNLDADDQRWKFLLHKLWQQTDQLTANYLRAAGSTLPYQEGVAREQARDRAKRSYEYMLRLLLELPLPDDLVDLDQEIAGAWVEQNQPLEVLMEVTHLDYKILWSALLWNSAKQDLPLLATRADQMWGVVHDWSRRLQAAYAAQALVRAHQSEDRRLDYASRLLSAEEPSAALVESTAAVLGVDPAADFTVAAAPVAERDVVRAVHARLAPGQRGFWIDDGGHVLLVAVLPPGGLAEVTGWWADTRCALAPAAHGLAEVPARARLAVSLFEVLPAQGRPFQVVDLWDRMAARDARGWALDLRTAVLGELATRTDYEAARLLETVQVYAGLGSVTATAQAIYCHRNTVVNRLRTFRELTGHDMTVPRQAAAVVLALAGDRPVEPGTRR